MPFSLTDPFFDKKMINSKKKGNSFERKMCNWLDKVFDGLFPKFRSGGKFSSKLAHRTPQSGAAATTKGLGWFSGDAITSIKILDLPVKFEFKDYKKLGIYRFWNKHRDETGSNSLPILIVHANFERDDLVIMEKNDWAALVRRSIEKNNS